MSIYKYLYRTHKGYVVFREPEDYFSMRYKKKISIKLDDTFNGADFYFDLDSWFWPLHDIIKRDGKWSDGSHCSNWQASTVAFDILWSEKRYIHAPIVFIGTLVGGYTKQLFKGLKL